MRERHLKMVCSENAEARREEVVQPCCTVVIVSGFKVHSALYGDGKERYEDMTGIVQEWVSKEWWPENWEEMLYATRKPRAVGGVEIAIPSGTQEGDLIVGHVKAMSSGLWIYSAAYGYDHEHKIDVTERVRALVENNSLDIVVNNSTLTPDQNPFRGKKKTLSVQYSYDGGPKQLLQRQEKDWLIIGPAVKAEAERFIAGLRDKIELMKDETFTEKPQSIPNLWPKSISHPPQTCAALNDYLIRRFQISPQRLRGPMPIELRDFHRNDLAQLFAELGFKRGAEIGVAEGNYSEVLLKANPECELLLVDPWHAYAGNPQNKSNDKHEFAYNEVIRKTKDYPHVDIRQGYSMDVVDGIMLGELDFVYIDACHLFDDCVMDIIEWSKRVRSGGVVSGDDYYQLDQKRWVGGGVVEAVQAYTNAHRIGLWFICNAHRSTDYFWVKP